MDLIQKGEPNETCPKNQWTKKDDLEENTMMDTPGDKDRDLNQGLAIDRRAIDVSTQGARSSLAKCPGTEEKISIKRNWQTGRVTLLRALKARRWRRGFDY